MIEYARYQSGLVRVSAAAGADLSLRRTIFFAAIPSTKKTRPAWCRAGSSAPTGAADESDGQSIILPYSVR